MNGVLIFEAGGVLSAVPVEVVEEIRDRVPLTPIPGAPDDVLGLLQHGGRMIPVIDVAARTGREAPDRSPATDLQGCVVVIQSDEQPMRRWCGLFVARVLGVRHPDDGDARKVPFIDLKALLNHDEVHTPLPGAPRGGAGGIPQSKARA